MMCSPALPTYNSCPHLGRLRRMRFETQIFLERVLVGLAGADAQHVVDRRDENLAVADLPGAGARGDDVDHLVGDTGIDGDLDPKFWQEVHDIFGAAVDL